ncbi:MAG: alpha/beta hydrolase fold domain-containing protein [Maritimibacter sp.]|nr:alpha/beta hydrolase fold domain-containing protein [Maritimibacter sp.]
MSLRLKLLHLFGRAVMRRSAATAPPLEMRADFERLTTRHLPMPPWTLALPRPLAPGLDALVITNRPGSRPAPVDRALLWFHGGAFVAGSPRTHAAMLARLARATGLEVVLPDYRRAPEHPFPAAPDDARAAFDALVARGIAPEGIVIGGDSAGGNLAFGLLAALLGEGIRPAGVVGMSPVTDLTFSGASIVENAVTDTMLPADRQGDVPRYYLAGADPTDPRASPLFADFPAPPPVFLQYSASEILRDDNRRLVEKLRAAGGTVVADEWPDTPHVFTLFAAYVPEAREGLARTARFMNGLWEGRG